MESIQAPITVMKRYEWKFILSAEQTDFLCERLQGHMEPDAYGLTTKLCADVLCDVLDTGVIALCTGNNCFGHGDNIPVVGSQSINTNRI